MVAGRLVEKNGYWYVVLSYKDVTGKRKQPWINTGLSCHGNKRKADEILKEYKEKFDIKAEKLITEVEKERNQKSEVLFGDYLLQWLNDIKKTIELSSFSGYQRNITRVIVPYFNKKGITLGMLDGHIIDEFYQSELDRGVSANTVIHYHANIRKALDDAFKNNLIPCNYADKAHRPKMEEYVASYYNKDELMELFEIVKGKKIEFAVLMASFYGLRREEIVGLKWSCIDLQNKTITIKHTVTECSVDGKFQILAKDRAKTKKSIRTLPLVPYIEHLLMCMKAKETVNKEFFGIQYNYAYDEYIYKEDNGKLIRPCYITQHFTDSVIKKNGLKKIRFHDLRHSCATLLRSQEVPMEDIQKWLGHSQITTTEHLYAHFEYKSHIRSASKIAGVLTGN